MGGNAPALTAALTAVVDAGTDAVWRAITDPAALIRWDAAALALIEPADAWPIVGAPLVWRYQLGAVSLTLRDTPAEVVPEKRLRSTVALGSFRFEQIWSLADEGLESDRARVGLSIVAANAVPVVGAELDRFDVRRRSAEYIDGKIRGLRAWFAADSAR